MDPNQDETDQRCYLRDFCVQAGWQPGGRRYPVLRQRVRARLLARRTYTGRQGSQGETLFGNYPKKTLIQLKTWSDRVES